MRAFGALEAGVNGVHARDVDQLPRWIGDEIWVIELEGEVLRPEAALVAPSGRLVGPLAAWSPEARAGFARACARRAAGFAERAPAAATAPILAAIERFAAAGRTGPAGYWSAVLAGQSVAGRRAGPDYDREFAGERAA